MKKIISVNSPTGTNEYKLISAFDSYVVLDSAKKDANGFTIVYVCKADDTSLSYVEGEEWEQAKKNLIAAVKNDGVTWKNVNDSYEAGEMIGHQISLKDNNLQALESNYDESIENDIENQVQSELDIPIINGEAPVEETKEEAPVNNLEDSIANVDMNSPIDIISDGKQLNDGTNEIPTVEPIEGDDIMEEVPGQDINSEEVVAQGDQIVDAIPDAEEQVAISDQPVISEKPVPAVEPVTQEQVVQEIPTSVEQQAVAEQPAIEETAVQPAVPGEIPVETEQVSQIVPEHQVMPEQNVTAEFQAQGVATTEQNVGSGVSTQNVVSAVQPVVEQSDLITDQPSSGSANVMPVLDNPTIGENPSGTIEPTAVTEQNITSEVLTQNVASAVQPVIQNNPQEFQENMNQLVSTIILVNNLYTMIQEQQQRLNEKEQELNEKEQKLNEEQKNVEALKQSLMLAKQQNEQAMAYNQQMNRQVTPQQVQGQVRALQA